MNRTRLTFFIVLSVVMGIVALSLVLELLASTLLLPIYVATTIFSVGVVSLDFLGILGQEGDDGGADGDGFDGDAFDGDVIDGDVIDGEVADGADFDVDGDGDGPHGLEGTGFDSGDDTHVHTLGHLHEIDRARGSRVLQILAYLRMTVYFCLGFGPTGWVALASGRTALASLGSGILVGVLALILASAFFRFQRSDTDSSLQPHELLRAQATVTIPLTHTTMGRVRVHLGMNVTEQYALAAEPGRSFHNGDTVQIARVTDECVYVV